MGAVILAPGFTPLTRPGSRPTTTRLIPMSSPASSSSGSSRPRVPTKAISSGPPITRSRRRSHGFSAWAPGTSTTATTAYCSAVCCMYAIKEAVIAKEHSPKGLDTAIFYMDMRTYGKDFEKYYKRAEKERGVRFIRSRIHSIDPVENDQAQSSLRDRIRGDQGGELRHGGALHRPRARGGRSANWRGSSGSSSTSMPMQRPAVSRP